MNSDEQLFWGIYAIVSALIALFGGYNNTDDDWTKGLTYGIGLFFTWPLVILRNMVR